MCLLPEDLDLRLWGDTTTVAYNAVKMSLQACNDQNKTINKINGAE